MFFDDDHVKTVAEDLSLSKPEKVMRIGHEQTNESRP